jgi:hypothetical protein
MFIVYVLFIVYVTLPPGVSPTAVDINNNNNKFTNLSAPKDILKHPM